MGAVNLYKSSGGTILPPPSSSRTTTIPGMPAFVVGEEVRISSQEIRAVRPGELPGTVRPGMVARTVDAEEVSR